MQVKALVRGGGDLASGVARRLFLAGCTVVILERPEPLAIRRAVSFATAVYAGRVEVEGVSAQLSDITPSETAEYIAVIVDEDANTISSWQPDVVVDARMLKRTPDDCDTSLAPLVIGLGPGFTASRNCHVVIETQRGHNLGRVIQRGEAEADTGVPDDVAGHGAARVLRAPADGRFTGTMEIGDAVVAGQSVGMVDTAAVESRIDGVVRGLLHSGVSVRRGAKIGDIDPRGIREYCFTVSDKANAVAGGVLEAVLSKYSGRLT